jgi:CRISPR-associated endonuclease Csn1
MRVLGIDLGIASCGWAVVETDIVNPFLVATGVRCFDAPLVDKTGEPKSAARRTARGQRRVIRRRKQRMQRVRLILHHAGLLDSADGDALREALRRIQRPSAAENPTPWRLRADALDRLLSNEEFSVVLGHIARHRGFRSNSKRDAAANAMDETSKMKKAMEQTREGLAKYRSFGEMIAGDPKFAKRKRNRDKDYSHTPKRSDLAAEVASIFSAQRRFGNAKVTTELQLEFASAAFDQRPLQDSEDKVGSCPFESDEKRTAKHAPSFELFRFLSRLTAMRLTAGRSERALDPKEIARAAHGFGEQKGVTFKTMRKLLDLDPNVRFAGVAPDKEGMDVAARAGAAAAGAHALRGVLGSAPWNALGRTPEKLDRIAEVLTFREDIGRIREGLQDVGLEPLVLEKLLEAAQEGAFGEFRGAAHISAKAARNIIPGLREGLVYSEACARVGYDHAARPAVSLGQINSPVTRRAFGEAIKQIRNVARVYAPIDSVHIELARDVGKSAEERRKLTNGIEDRNAEKDRRKGLAAGILGRPVSDDELLRYELAAEQLFKCAYCGRPIAPDGFRADDTRYQVDHILPWSRFGDDSYLNKTLCCTGCNQEKRSRTPYEWFQTDKTEAQWEAFIGGFEGLKEMKGLKKRNLRLKDAEAVEEKFKNRNLTDTRWASRLLADELKRMFPAPEGKRRVFPRPGAITSKLRRAWGLETLKKVDGERVSDDRHHAVDAVVLALTTESLLKAITEETKRRETEGRADDIFHVPQPWPHFRTEVEHAVYGVNGVGGVFVSRAERRRARGKAHDATIKQIRQVDGEEIVFERKAIEKLSLNDLDRIPTPDPYGKVANPKKLRDELAESLREWIEAGKPKDALPRSPKGDVIRKVRVETNAKVGVRLGGGTVDRGEMARVDVFRKANKKGKFQYFLVPIYPHEIATMDAPPMRAALAYAPDDEWPVVDASYEYLWPINQRTWLKATKASGEVVEGYFVGMNRSNGAIALSAQADPDAITSGIGVKTLQALQKFAVDRLGRLSEVQRESRTWRGKVCT